MNFNDKAKEWDKKQQFHERARIIAVEIKKFLKLNNEMRALDFGCGTGMLSNNFRDDFKSITLIDTSSGMLDVLKEKIINEKITNFTPILLDLSSENFSPEVDPFDVIYTSMTLHHVTDTASIISKFSSILKVGGYVCIADLVSEDGRFHQGDVDPNIHHGFDRTKLELIMHNAGLEPVFYKVILDIDREFEDGEVKKYPVFLIIAKKSE
jgi:ubiquinone/menaquinone biosynthesis C-methylase UbiE